MPPRPAARPYRWLAEHYDQLFSPYLDAEARQHVLGEILPKVRSACDLACGTGSTALRLAGQGIRMFAVDLSPHMCRKARQKARQAGLPLHVIQADLRSFRLPEPVDLVTCEFDAINHVPRRADLARVARAVARALRPGGWFYFDANNRLAFQEAWPRAFWIERPGFVVVMHGAYGGPRDKDRAWSDIEWFFPEGKLWRRHQEHVEEVCWSPAEVRSTLRAAGFASIRSWDAAPFMKSNLDVRPGHRTVWLARIPAGRGKKDVPF